MRYSRTAKCIWWWTFLISTQQQHQKYANLCADQHLGNQDVYEINIQRTSWENKGANKKDSCMNFYNRKKLLYLKIDVTGIDLWAGLLQVRRGMNWPPAEASDTILQLIGFTSKILPTAETHDNNIECEASCILHRLKNSTTMFLLEK